MRMAFAGVDVVLVNSWCDYECTDNTSVQQCLKETLKGCHLWSTWQYYYWINVDIYVDWYIESVCMSLCMCLSVCRWIYGRESRCLPLSLNMSLCNSVCLCVGEFTAESQLLLKIEREKVRARTDPWKVQLLLNLATVNWFTLCSYKNSNPFLPRDAMHPRY